MSLGTASNEKYRQPLCWIFTLSFVLMTFLPRSLDDTMFMDGVTYASISRNMALGIGSFWRPFFAHSFWLPYDNGAFFSGHPPLMFGMQSILFRIWGDTTAVENAWNLIILICSVLIIKKIWEKLFEELPDYKRYAWIAILCWYAMTIVYYSIPNNFLDSTMAVFCLLSCYYQLIYMKGPGTKETYLWMIVAGVCVFLAFLTKGPVGLYPLAFTTIWGLFDKTTPMSVDRRSKRKRVIWATGLMTITFTISMGALLLYKPASEFLRIYFQNQVVQAVMQKREQTGVGLAAHFDLLRELLRNIYPHLVAWICFTLGAVFFKIKLESSRAVRQIGVFTLLVALSGILPMLISRKQYPHYLLPALPFVALFFATVLVEKFHAIAELKKNLSIAILCIGILCCCTVMIKKVADPNPDVIAESAKRIKGFVAKEATIGICPDMYQNGTIHAYLQRYHLLSLSTNIDSTRYVLADSTCISRFDPKKDTTVQLDGGYFLVIRNVAKIPRQDQENMSLPE
jgi:4-amino-4-deoxy-L-arabinose transferase-like glycosyltransferase